MKKAKGALETLKEKFPHFYSVRRSGVLGRRERSLSQERDQYGSMPQNPLTMISLKHKVRMRMASPGGDCAWRSCSKNDAHTAVISTASHSQFFLPRFPSCPVPKSCSPGNLKFPFLTSESLSYDFPSTPDGGSFP